MNFSSGFRLEAGWSRWSGGGAWARKFANEPFTEEEADIILESGAKAIRSRKEIQHPHNNISTSSIFIDNDRRILVGDPWITPPAYNQEMTQNVFACPSP